MLGAMFGIASCHLISRKRGYPVGGRFSLREVIRSFFSALPALGLPFIIIGGILSGVFTPTESAGVARGVRDRGRGCTRGS